MKSRVLRGFAAFLSAGAAVTACVVAAGSAQAAEAPQSNGENDYSIQNTSGLPFQLTGVKQVLGNGFGIDQPGGLSGVPGETQSFEIQNWIGHGDWTEFTYKNGSTTVTLVADQYRDLGEDRSHCEISGPNERGIRCGATGTGGGGGRAYLTQLWIAGPSTS
ncbi:hypothetical protein [Streptomyces sp. NPDC008121]|uniref:hypothetical protein n=1 Tax=Streptomyces sp. NPDC008121 TaxID=3364809 RepID=UPI0036E59B47